ncbi:hypothetical protein COEREDRAFT_60670, partial [Coemansia reversa NRRL 1564]
FGPKLIFLVYISFPCGATRVLSASYSPSLPHIFSSAFLCSYRSSHYFPSKLSLFVLLFLRQILQFARIRTLQLLPLTPHLYTPHYIDAQERGSYVLIKARYSSIPQEPHCPAP